MTHLETILKEMFARVGQEYTLVAVNEQGWWLNFTWGEDEKREFAAWMKDYLLNSRAARKEMMARPVKNAEAIERTVDQFLLAYGWTPLSDKVKRSENRH